MKCVICGKSFGGFLSGVGWTMYKDGGETHTTVRIVLTTYLKKRKVVSNVCFSTSKILSVRK